MIKTNEENIRHYEEMKSENYEAQSENYREWIDMSISFH